MEQVQKKLQKNVKGQLRMEQTSIMRKGLDKVS
jgi:hypothetical protein